MFRIAGILFIDRVDKRSRDRRAVALHDKANILVDSRTQLDEAGLAAALAVEDHELERMFAVRQHDTGVRVHALHAKAKIPFDGRARVGERTGHAFDHRNANGGQTGSGVRRTRGSNKRADDTHDATSNKPLRRLPACDARPRSWDRRLGRHRSLALKETTRRKPEPRSRPIVHPWINDSKANRGS